MRELNRTLVLDVVKRQSPVSRAAIARETSLAKPTVSGLVESLIEDGLVREIGVGSILPGAGRPPILLEFNSRSRYVVGMQIGVRRTNLVVADALGKELDRREVATPGGAADHALRSLAKTVLDMMKTGGVPKEKLASVGVCVPGLIEMDTGTCLLAPNLDWHDVPVSGILESVLDVPIHVMNTTDAAVVVESIDGAARGARDIVMLYAGRGVGAAVISDGRLIRGHFGLAGEIGHCYLPGATTKCMCGKVGCLETLTDGPAIARLTSEAIAAGEESVLSSRAPGDLTAQDVAVAAAQGDELAKNVLAGAGRNLGIAASWLITLFNPEVFLLGGGVASAGELLLGPLRRAAAEHTMAQSAERVSIRPWTLGRDAGVTGAVLVALQNSESYYRVMFQG